MALSPGDGRRSPRYLLAIILLLSLALSSAVLAASPSGADGNEGPNAPAAFRSVSAGANHSCGVLANGDLKCWGANDSGQLGLGTTATRGDDPSEMGSALPRVDLGTGRTAVAVSAGVGHTCAVLDNGDLKCWGANESGQLGLGDTAPRGDDPNEMGDQLPRVNLGAGRTAVAVAAGGGHTCAVLDNFTLKCWGANFSGQLGLGDTNSRGDGPDDGVPDSMASLPSVQLGSGRSARAVTAGENHTCALLDNATVKCWGSNFSGQLGLGDTNSRGDGPDGDINDTMSALPAVVLGAGRTATALTAGNNHTCVLLDNGAVKCWGENLEGQLGLGDTATRGDGQDAGMASLAAVNLGAGRTATGITAGASHTCARLDNGTAKCWGDGAFGQLGLGDTNNRGDGADDGVPDTMSALPAIALGTGRTATAVTAGGTHTCARLDDGSVKCWGKNQFGQLGQGDTNRRGDGPNEMGDALPAVLFESPPAPAMTVAQTVDEPSVYVGGTVHLHVHVTNTGNVALSNVTVADPNATGCAVSTPFTLVVGAVRTIDCTHVAVPGDIPTYSNTATADSAETAPVASNAVNVTVEAAPAASLTAVQTAVESSVAVGATVHLQVRVTNTGNVALHNVTVTAPNATTCQGDPFGLAVAASVTVDCAHVAVAGDAPSYTNTASVDSDETAPLASNQVTVAVGATQGSGLAAVQSADESTVAVGATVHLHLRVTNTGATAVNHVTVIDPSAVGCQVAPFSLAAGAQRTIDCTHLVGVGDVPIYANPATVASDETIPVPFERVAVGVVMVAQPSMAVTQTLDESSVVVGDPVHLHVRVANSGNVVLHNVTLTDVNAPDCQVAPFTLAVGADRTVNCTHVAVAGDAPSYSNTATADSDETAPVASNQASVTVGTLPPLLSLAAGINHTCALLTDHRVRCWGGNNAGQLGLGDTIARGDGPGEMGANLPAVDLGTGRTANAIAAGGYHTCALLDNGTVKCWGYNNHGQLGQGDTAIRGMSPGQMGDTLLPVNLGTGRTAVGISVRGSHSCAVLDNGSVKCWGYNVYGQLGLGDTADRGDAPGEMGDSLPAVSLGTGRSATVVTAGRFHTCARLDNGTVKCWGRGDLGRLGLGDTVRRGDGAGEMGDSLPAVSLGAGRTATTVVAGGGDHTCARLDNGTVKCWGGNAFGQLGLGDVAARGDGAGEMGDSLPAVSLGAGRTATSVSVGDNHTCARLDNGSVKCWGANTNGQLGLGDVAARGDAAGEMGDVLPAVALGTGRTASAVVVGGNHSCVLRDTGTVGCWGLDQVGQLGDGATANRGDGAGEMGDSLSVLPIQDAADPSVDLRSPAAGASYARNQLVAADFSCADDTSGFGVASCVGTVADGELVDTSTLGSHTFTVVATDLAGNDRTITRTYTVRDLIDPTIELSTPPAGAVYARGQAVAAAFGCDDEVNGSGLASCDGTVANGANLDTATLGWHEFSVVAVDHAGNRRTVTHLYAVRDVTDPTVDLRSPASGAVFDRGQVVAADYSCADEAGGSGVASCVGPVADGANVDTSALGPHDFTVVATDAAGNHHSVTRSYSVRDVTDPTVELRSPASGAVFDRGQVVAADFSCADEAGGSGIASCVGTVADGDPVNTANLGTRQFSVTASDHTGNEHTVAVSYTVRDVTDPTVDLRSPASGAVFDRGQVVAADFSCADEAGGSGIASCVGTVADGVNLDTSTPGAHEVTVVATDVAGNDHSVTRSYTVVEHRPDAKVRRGTTGTFVGNDVYNGTGSGQTAIGSAAPGASVTYYVSAQNDGSVAEAMKLKGSASSSRLTIRYSAAGADITSRVIAGTYLTPTLQPGASQLVRVTVTVAPAAPAGSRSSASLTVRSVGATAVKDTVKFVTSRR